MIASISVIIACKSISRHIFLIIVSATIILNFSPAIAIAPLVVILFGIVIPPLIFAALVGALILILMFMIGMGT